MIALSTLITPKHKLSYHEYQRSKMHSKRDLKKSETSGKRQDVVSERQFKVKDYRMHPDQFYQAKKMEKF